MSLPGNPVPEDVYALSSDKGEAIPLDVARPVGCLHYSGPGTLGVELAEDLNLVSMISQVRFTISYGAEVAPVMGYSPRTFIGLPDVIYDLVLPKSFRLTLHEPGEFIGNILQKWGQLRNIGSYYNS